MIDVCVVGCGAVATWRAKYVGRQENFRVAAVVDPNPAAGWEVAPLFGGGARPRILTAVDDPSAYGLAVVQTPNGLHQTCSAPFIEAGVPVVVEKPLTLTWDDINWFAKREREGAWICGAYNSRFAKGVASAYWASREQKLVTLSSNKMRCRSGEYYSDGWHGTWAYDGGVLAQQAIHCVDLVCWAAGTREPKRVAALGFNQRHSIECEDTGTVLMDFGDCAATVSGTTAAGINGRASLEIVTTEGIYGTRDGGWDGGAEVLWRDIAQALRTGGPPPVSVASVLPGLRTMHAIYVSMAQDGAWTDVGAVHPKLGQPDLTQAA